MISSGLSCSCLIALAPPLLPAFSSTDCFNCFIFPLRPPSDPPLLRRWRSWGPSAATPTFNFFLLCHGRCNLPRLSHFHYDTLEQRNPVCSLTSAPPFNCLPRLLLCQVPQRETTPLLSLWCVCESVCICLVGTGPAALCPGFQTWRAPVVYRR